MPILGRFGNLVFSLDPVVYIWQCEFKRYKYCLVGGKFEFKIVEDEGSF